jgi:hypothetical protein
MRYWASSAVSADGSMPKVERISSPYLRSSWWTVLSDGWILPGLAAFASTTAPTTLPPWHGSIPYQLDGRFRVARLGFPVAIMVFEGLIIAEQALDLARFAGNTVLAHSRSLAAKEAPRT